MGKTIYSKHKTDPATAERFADSNDEHVIQMVTLFFCSGIGGPQKYNGKSMIDAHSGMGINHLEFIHITDHVLTSMDEHNYNNKERDEVLSILYSLKGDIINK